MKKKLLSAYIFVLRILAQAAISRYKPRVIGVTGSVGKTSTKTAIYAMLRHSLDKRVRAPGGSLNTEIGLPLAILGEYKQFNGILFAIGTVVKGVFQFLNPKAGKKYPEILVLEYGIDSPGDMDVHLGIVRPDVAVMTAIGDVPVHIEFYDGGRPQVAEEKGKLVRAVKYGGTAVLNVDDEDVALMRKLTDRNIITYGFSKDADVRAVGFRNESDSGKPVGISFTLESRGQSVPVKIDKVLGKSQAYAALAAAAVGVVEGIDLQTISEALALYNGVKGRTRLLPGIKNSLIIDDTYNASPSSSRAGLEVLSDVKAKRKVAVLGDMMELGDYMEGAHRKLGKEVASVADVVITVGTRAEFVKEGAVDAGFKAKIESFPDSNAAKLSVQEIIKEGDVVYVKGSESARMEKIVEEIMAEPRRAKELLVRQYGKWLKT